MIFATVHWEEWVDLGSVGAITRIILLIVVGLPLLKIVAGLIAKAVAHRHSPQTAMVTRKLVFYSGFIVTLMMVLNEMGFHLATLLGAAGIVGIALGFASQTSVSNIISGLFLISERPFAVGDVMQVGETTGVVLSIDLLSAKVRTFDNRYVRIPNETLIKTEVINITRYPIRRLDLAVGVAYKEDIDRVQDVLRDVADKNALCLDEPEPLFIFKSFGDSALECQFSVWFKREDIINVRNTMMRDIKKRFDEEGIEIPFPHRTVYTGSVTTPFPVQVLGDSPESVPTSNRGVEEQTRIQPVDRSRLSPDTD